MKTKLFPLTIFLHTLGGTKTVKATSIFVFCAPKKSGKGIENDTIFVI